MILIFFCNIIISIIYSQIFLSLRIVLKKYVYILSTIFFLILFGFKSNSQCISYTPSCIITGQQITFSSNQSWLDEWRIFDNSGNLVSSYNGTIIQHTFNTQGNYTIQTGYIFPPGSGNFQDDCTENIIVVNQAIGLSVTNNSTLICSGGSIDYSSLGINTVNATGNVSYSWTTSPNNLSWNGLTNFLIPGSETSVTLTATDDATGCSDTETISLSYQSTNANASFTPSTNMVQCPGQIVTFYPTNIDTTLYSYDWEIDGVPQNQPNNDTLTVPIFPNGTNNISITLYVTDSNGCFDELTQTISISTQGYVTFDTSQSGLIFSQASFDQDLNCFVYCQNDSSITDTLVNMNWPDTNGIDYIIIDWSNGIRDSITDGIDMHLFPFNVSGLTSNVTITTYYIGSCPPSTVSFCFVYNQQIPPTFVTFTPSTTSSLCKGDTVDYLFDPNVFQMPLNGTLYFVTWCDSLTTDTIAIWDYYDVQDNTFLYDYPDPAMLDEVMIVFQHVFEESSCGCVFYQNGVGMVYDMFGLVPIFYSECQSFPLTFGSPQYIPPDPTASFDVPDSICVPGTITMENNSSFGCTNSVNPLYMPSSTPYGIVQPSFFYDFGNCVSLDTTPTQSQYNSNNYVDITYTYTDPGIYPVELFAQNVCTTIAYQDTVHIFPPPNVSFTSDSASSISTPFIDFPIPGIIPIKSFILPIFFIC